MENRKQLNLELSTLKDLRTIIEAYEEIAAARMRKVKKSVLQSRSFLNGLNEVYLRVMYTYRLYSQTKSKKGKGLNWLPLETNGKTVAVLLSSNTGLYGDIIKKTFNLFAQNTTKTSHDVVIVGRTGKVLYDNLGIKKDYKYFEVSDTGIDLEKTKVILEYILSYTNIIVFHGVFASVLSQVPFATFVTGKAKELESQDEIHELKCIIEPSVEEVTKFFEKQILSSIFEQTVYESSLSKFASRMMSLDFASENILSSITKVNFARLKVRHQKNDFEQLQKISGQILWS